MKQYDVVIIGGGIIGLNTAYYLSKEGKSVVLIDKNKIGKECSHGNCGLISPSHALPLNSYSLMIKAIKWLFKDDSPFFIRPQADLKFLSFLLHFALNCNANQVERGKQALNAILESSRRLFDEIIRDEKISCNWNTQGIYFAFMDEENFEEYRETDAILRAINVRAKPMIGREFHQAEPAIQERVYGAWLYENDASFRPDEYLKSLKDTCEKSGVTIIEHCEVFRIESEHKKVNKIVTSQGEFQGNNYLLSLGAWTALFEKQLGLMIPIVPGKGYSITMKAPSLTPKMPIIFEEKKVVVTPWSNGYRLGGTMEFAGYDNQLNRTRLNALKRAAVEYLKYPTTEDIEEEWTGWRPMTADGLPILDKSPLHHNLYLAAGHNMLGLSLGSGTGKLMTELICGKTPHIDPKPYRFGR